MEFINRKMETKQRGKSTTKIKTKSGSTWPPMPSKRFQTTIWIKSWGVTSTTMEEWVVQYRKAKKWAEIFRILESRDIAKNKINWWVNSSKIWLKIKCKIQQMSMDLITKSLGLLEPQLSNKTTTLLSTFRPKTQTLKSAMWYKTQPLVPLNWLGWEISPLQ